MFDYIIDTNIVMSMLISGKSHYKAILSVYNFHLPEYSITELDEHKEVILEKTRFNEEELKDFVYFVFKSISVIPNIALSKKSIKTANELCNNIDIDDVSFVALCCDMNIPLITRDDILYTGLRKKGFKNVIMFDDFLRTICQ